jgi:2-(1,2-epoxy-1,2-dihydrophenyl)acetyl-CoA isomerase
VTRTAPSAASCAGTGKAFCAGGDVKDFNDSPDRIGILIKELTTYLHGAVSRRPHRCPCHGRERRGGGGGLALAGTRGRAESAKFTMAFQIAASRDGCLPTSCRA